ncbi:MAG TPA: SCP2 sterol-binding domain-containing protein [Anaeromyxobacteraceae bacterium]|nr:SCP2 sterol-binding domain-containing protein [Anaeromyxobacteraceae bacterium]
MIFPSEAWLRAVVEAVNRHPELPRALAGLGPDLGAVVEPEPPGLRRAFAVYGRQEGGRIAAVRVLADEDDLWELEPAYVVRASYGVWKALVRGEDPVRAALSGRVRVEGDLQALLRRAGYRPILDAALASVATEFADEGEGP